MVDFSPWTTLLLTALLAVAAFSLHPLIRGSARDAMRCVSRHPAVISVPVTFAAGYAIFQWVAQAFLIQRAGESVADWAVFFPVFGMVDAPYDWQWILTRAAERTAAVGNDLVFTFPLSAWIVLLALVFRTRLVIEMIRALRSRFPRMWFPLVFFMALCAACAAVKPFVYLFLPEILDFFPLDPGLGYSIAGGVNVMAMIFETFVGTYVTVAIMLLTFSWIRGMDVERRRLHFFAARRMGYAMKWTLVTMMLSLLLFGLPLLVQTSGLGTEWHDDLLRWTDSGARLVLAFVLLAFFPMQASLVFHNGSLRKALEKTRTLVCRKAFVLGTFFVGCALAFVTVEIGAHLFSQGVDPASSPGMAGSGFFQMISSAVGGWLLVVWVCLYRRLGSQAKPVVF